MSNGTSPSVLSFLRQYRFQRKPNDPAGSSSPVTVTSSPSGSREYHANIKRRSDEYGTCL